MSKNSISDEDKALFREAVNDVTPLNSEGKDTNVPQKPKDNKSKTQTLMSEQFIQKITKYALSSYYSQELGAESILSYAQANFPKKRLLELQKGKMPIDRRLDLHGYQPEEAKEKLLCCILHAFENNERVLLIIHGKGGRQQEAPVLKNLVNHWLVQLSEVLAFHSAQPKDGGNGAVYVLLKRNRKEI